MSVSGVSNGSYTVTGQVKSFSELPARKASSSEMEKLNQAVAGASYAGSRQADNAPENLYAQVKVSGKVVASVWKSGLVELPNEYAYLNSQISQTDSASGRAQLLAKALGGEVSYAAPSEGTSSYTFSESLKQLLKNT